MFLLKNKKVSKQEKIQRRATSHTKATLATDRRQQNSLLYDFSCCLCAT